MSRDANLEIISGSRNNLANFISEERTLFEEIEIPMLKINEDDFIIHGNSSFFQLFDLSQLDVSNKISINLKEIVQIYPLLAIVLDMAAEVRQTKLTIYKDIKRQETYYKVKAVSLEGDAICIMIYDMTLQKRFEDLLTYQHQMEAVSHIAAGVAHELRNPLSVIKGFFQLADLTNNYSKYYQTILSELNRMNGIIEDFLSVARKKTEHRLQSPYSLIKSLVEIIKSECILHNVNVHFQLEKTTKNVFVNEGMIKQVLLNVLRNSIEAFHQKENREFLVQTVVDEDHFYILMEDNGVGMPNEVIIQLGKPFFSTKENGTGIGIPLCKKIIEDHGGTFKIESQLNIGTKVEIALPICYS